MVKVFAYLSVFAATTFCITSAAKLNQRAIYNMMNDRAAKDQYHVAVSNEYSARDETTVAFQSSKAYPRALKRVGDKTMEVEEWILSESPQFLSEAQNSIKRDRQLYASRMFSLRHSMHDKVHKSKGHKKIFNATATQASFATPPPQKI
ncbi:hypothetical protein G6F57_015526 [Rhizopus arrhizus]|uniref:Uncharacterized protein n=1 Tax=Rhizopus oryzae TaxID=64495 RepID=A0A9P6WWD8_RHIOR|nr:hypothetical protein G6F23_006513 [Rhizopus arrhizus]KAG1392787.1 hypothetical protein G6F58_012440 [Rhizopus delemar]KAG0752632.1 hypothetical protein G6F24_013460 [Rhizopus arrhizus]KAG0774310.1 hypothetical protein G6F22_014166 [Rhizopus arrhizus]KAG0787852.1 hypothetical protein G6F21_007622 [Rhizopus arrhizus]